MLGAPYCVMQIKHYENLVSNYPISLYERADPDGSLPPFHDPFLGSAPDLSPVSVVDSEWEAEPECFSHSPGVELRAGFLDLCSEGYPELGPGPDILVTYPQWSNSVF